MSWMPPKERSCTKTLVTPRWTSMAVVINHDAIASYSMETSMSATKGSSSTLEKMCNSHCNFFSSSTPATTTMKRMRSWKPA
jgi:hypothetical protein